MILMKEMPPNQIQDGGMPKNSHKSFFFFSTQINVLFRDLSNTFRRKKRTHLICLNCLVCIFFHLNKSVWHCSRAAQNGRVVFAYSYLYHIISCACCFHISQTCYIDCETLYCCFVFLFVKPVFVASNHNGGEKGSTPTSRLIKATSYTH